MAEQKFCWDFWYYFFSISVEPGIILYTIDRTNETLSDISTFSWSLLWLEYHIYWAASLPRDMKVSPPISMVVTYFTDYIR